MPELERNEMTPKRPHRVVRRSRRAEVLTVLLIGLAARPLAAAEPDARELYERGAEAYREARYETAIELLLRAHRLEPHSELNYDLGRAYEGAGDLTRAIASFREYLRLEPNAKDRAVVEARVANLERRMPTPLQPLVNVTSNPAGATVAIDNRVVGTTPSKEGGQTQANIASMSAKAGHHPFRVKLAEGQQTEFHLELEAESNRRRCVRRRRPNPSAVRKNLTAGLE